MVTLGWGLSTLRLIWDTSRGWALHQGCSRGHSRRCLRTLSWGAVCGSPGTACAISNRGTGLTPGLESMPSMANHGWRTAEGPKWGGRAAGDCRCRQGSSGVGGLSSARQVSCQRAVVGARQERASACSGAAGARQGTAAEDGSGVRQQGEMQGRGLSAQVLSSWCK